MYVQYSGGIKIGVSWFDTYDLFAKIMWIWFHGMGILFAGIILYLIKDMMRIWKE